MKKIFFAIVAAGIATFSIHESRAQSWNDVLNSVFGENSTSNKNSTKQNTGGLGAGLSNLDISNGLKEALSLGANNASKQLSTTDGFLKNAAVKILMPPEVQKVEKALRQFGMGSLADQAIVAMNRAAEDAASKAGPIFVSAITRITLNDALGILRGGNNAATNYLQRTTQQQLMSAFSPVVKQSLTKVGAERIWQQAFSAYNKLPGVSKVNTDLTNYVTQKATEGMFVSIAAEELKIRQNPTGQASNLLRKVFGSGK